MQAITLFLRLQTQWRIAAGFGFARFVGLDYGGVQHAMSLANIPRRDRERLFEQLQVMESAALKELNKADG
jgi:hypothetical protein